MSAFKNILKLFFEYEKQENKVIQPEIEE